MLLARDVVHAQVVASVVLDPVQMAVEVVVDHVLHNVVLTDALVAVDRVPDHALDTAGVNAPLIALAIISLCNPLTALLACIWFGINGNIAIISLYAVLYVVFSIIDIMV